MAFEQPLCQILRTPQGSTRTRGTGQLWVSPAVPSAPCSRQLILSQLTSTAVYSAAQTQWLCVHSVLRSIGYSCVSQINNYPQGIKNLVIIAPKYIYLDNLPFNLEFLTIYTVINDEIINSEKYENLKIPFGCKFLINDLVMV